MSDVKPDSGKTNEEFYNVYIPLMFRREANPCRRRGADP